MKGKLSPEGVVAGGLAILSKERENAALKEKIKTEIIETKNGTRREEAAPEYRRIEAAAA